MIVEFKSDHDSKQKSMTLVLTFEAASISGRFLMPSRADVTILVFVVGSSSLISGSTLIDPFSEPL